MTRRTNKNFYSLNRFCHIHDYFMHQLLQVAQDKYYEYATTSLLTSIKYTNTLHIYTGTMSVTNWRYYIRCYIRRCYGLLKRKLRDKMFERLNTKVCDIDSFV